MTEADHADLSRRLALALGWREGTYPEPRMVVQRWGVVCWDGNKWRRFDYRDPAVIWLIAERYNCFPVHMSDGKWRAYIPGANQVAATTAAEAVALAVIGARP